VSHGERSGAGGHDGTRARGLLVVAEVGVALALLIGAGLLGRSFLLLLRSDLGFATENRAVVQLFLWDRNPTREQRLQRAREMVAAMEAKPGVERVGIASSAPFLPTAIISPVPIVIAGREQASSSQKLRARPNLTTPSYLDVLSIPLLSGRAFDAHDREDSRPVAMVSASLAASYFAGEDPIGRRVSLGTEGVEREIVGIVADVHHEAIDAPPVPEIFVPFEQTGWGSVVFLVHTSVDAGSLLPQLQEAVWEVDPGQSIFQAETMRSLVSDTLRQRRFNMVLLAAFAATALALAAIGIYGLISFSTRRRTREIGIRIALGSSRRAVVAMILAQGLRLGLAGVALGLGLALLLTRFLAHLLYAVRPIDFGTFAVLSVFMMLLAMVATYLPARRASRLDPVQALRE
jgi:putative ABC transport system permease protein